MTHAHDEHENEYDLREASITILDKARLEAAKAKCDELSAGYLPAVRNGVWIAAQAALPAEPVPADVAVTSFPPPEQNDVSHTAVPSADVAEMADAEAKLWKSLATTLHVYDLDVVKQHHILGKVQNLVSAYRSLLPRVATERDVLEALVKRMEYSDGDAEHWRGLNLHLQKRLSDSEAAMAGARKALEEISSPSQTTGLLWWQVRAREVLQSTPAPAQHEGEK